MASLSHNPRAPVLAVDNRLPGIGLTVLVHVVLIAGWHLTRKPPMDAPQAPGPEIQWVQIPAAPPRVEAAPRLPPPAPRREQATRRAASRPAASAPPAQPTPSISPEPGVPAETPPAPSAESILDKARRSVGDIDRALRKENRPLIVAPPDSPQIRMRKGMELARELAPTKMWEAPKVQELVNNTGDGARRTRVVTGNGTYCITERSPVTNVEMIEMHGKIRLTNCPAHEEPAKAQEWRTARD